MLSEIPLLNRPNDRKHSPTRPIFPSTSHSHFKIRAKFQNLEPADIVEQNIRGDDTLHRKGDQSKMVLGRFGQRGRDSRPANVDSKKVPRLRFHERQTRRPAIRNVGQLTSLEKSNF